MQPLNWTINTRTIKAIIGNYKKSVDVPPLEVLQTFHVSALKHLFNWWQKIYLFFCILQVIEHQDWIWVLETFYGRAHFSIMFFNGMERRTALKDSHPHPHNPKILYAYYAGEIKLRTSKKLYGNIKVLTSLA